MSKFHYQVYPYEYFDSFERFDETELPSIDRFYSSLTQETISEEEYEHARQVFEHFACKDLGAFHDLYLLTDVLVSNIVSHASIVENIQSPI